MAFVVEELSYAAPRPVAPPTRGLPFSPWLARFGAFVISLAIEALLVGALMLAGVIPTSIREPSKPRLIAIDLVAPDQNEAGSLRAVAATASVQDAEPSKLDVATSTDLPVEWSVSKLPPVPQTTSTPPAAISAGVGTAMKGTSNGGGYDPYAFASYQPSLIRPGMSSIPALRPKPDVLAWLEASLRQRQQMQGVSIAVRVAVGKDGRVTGVEIVSALPMASQAVVQNLVIGAPLFPADGTRPEGIPTTITLSI